MNSAQFLEQDLDLLLKTVLASTNEDFWLIDNDTLAFQGRRHRQGHRPRIVNITLQRLRANRGRPGGRTAMEGTGLGLAIYHRFAQLLGGEIDVKSTLEQGSIFKYSIPATFADQT